MSYTLTATFNLLVGIFGLSLFLFEGYHYQVLIMSFVSVATASFLFRRALECET